MERARLPYVLIELAVRSQWPGAGKWVCAIAPVRPLYRTSSCFRRPSSPLPSAPAAPHRTAPSPDTSRHALQLCFASCMSRVMCRRLTLASLPPACRNRALGCRRSRPGGACVVKALRPSTNLPADETSPKSLHDTPEAGVPAAHVMRRSPEELAGFVGRTSASFTACFSSTTTTA